MMKIKIQLETGEIETLKDISWVIELQEMRDKASRVLMEENDTNRYLKLQKEWREEFSKHYQRLNIQKLFYNFVRSRPWNDKDLVFSIQKPSSNTPRKRQRIKPIRQRIKATQN